MKSERTELSVAQIMTRPDNRAAGGMDPDKLKQLTESVRTHGILQPLIVRRAVLEDRHEIQLIAGHRRLAAAKDAGLKTVPCTVLEGADASEVEILSVVENLQRENPHPLDEADGFARLEALGMTRTAIAEQVGCHRNHVASRMRLVDLCPEVRAAWIAAPSLTVRGAEAIAQMTPDMQMQFAKRQDKRYGGGAGLNGTRPEEASEWARARSDKLADAPWDLADAALYPEAGACNTCPKRFGFQPGLFAEDAEDAGEPPEEPEARCGDRKCWKRKAKIHVDQARERAEANGVTLTDVTVGNAKGAVPTYRVDRYDPEKHANRKRRPKALLIVDGPDAGTVIDGFVKPERDPHAAHVRKQKKEREARRAREAERLPVLQAVAEAIDAHPSPVDLLLHDKMLWRLAVAVWSWAAEKAAAVHLEGAETNEYGHVEDPEVRAAAEAKVDAMDPHRRILYALAAGGMLAAERDDRDDLALIAELVGVPMPGAEP